MKSKINLIFLLIIAAAVFLLATNIVIASGRSNDNQLCKKNILTNYTKGIHSCSGDFVGSIHSCNLIRKSSLNDCRKLTENNLTLSNKTLLKSQIRNCIAQIVNNSSACKKNALVEKKLCMQKIKEDKNQNLQTCKQSNNSNESTQSNLNNNQTGYNRQENKTEENESREPVCGNNICEEGEANFCPVCTEGKTCPRRPCYLGFCPKDCKQ